RCSDAGAVVDEESAGDDVDAHVLRSSRALVLVQGQADELSTFLGGEATGLRGVVDDGHDHFVEQTRTAGDDIEMTHGERVIGTGTDDLHTLIVSARIGMSPHMRADWSSRLRLVCDLPQPGPLVRSEEHTSELQSRF